MAFGDAYLKQLKEWSAARHALRAVEAAAAIADPRTALRAQIIQWQSTISPDAAAAGFHLDDIRKAIPSATPQQLGLALWELNFRRRRVWLNDGPYRRRWYLPDQ